MGRLVERVTNVRSHRNGVCGEAFHTVLFRGEAGNMLGVVFEGDGRVAVLKVTDLVDPEDVGPGCYRGDVFEPELRSAIAHYEDGRPR
jgi:hypothetical protein